MADLKLKSVPYRGSLIFLKENEILLKIKMKYPISPSANLKKVKKAH
ncbi:hypothetical protein SAMN05661099_0967 [Daejeonella lutea]|uniref:Uncharacterized protein n=1 Tax=Daejeonella lutea TaxID=572036 RepID=A0A1T5ARG3_9SPHI|nr:hypothetical protein SAMN05661099_0967 [Daejeonella lutea]